MPNGLSDSFDEDRQELVVRIYGGAYSQSKRVLAETEILVKKVSEGKAIKYVRVDPDEDLTFIKVLEQGTWVTGCEVSTPKALVDLGLPRWTTMPLPETPLFCKIGESITVTFPVCVVEVS